MEVLAHPDPWRLEEELRRQIEHSQQDAPYRRVLVVVPTARLARHVRRRLAEGPGACLGVEVLHHRAVVFRLFQEAGQRAPEVLSQNLQQAMLSEALKAEPQGEWIRQAREFAGARRKLLATLRDLREAFLTPQQVHEHVARQAGHPHTSLAALYARYVAMLEEAREAHLTDEAGLTREALDTLAVAEVPWSRVLHHGAADLTGMHLVLWQGLAQRCRATFLLPAAEGPAWVAAREFARRHLLKDEAGNELVYLEDGSHGLLGTRLEQLHNESTDPAPPLQEGCLHLRHAQGGAAEVDAARREAQAAVAAGTPPEEILIVARQLDGGAVPYGQYWEQQVALDGWPWHSSHVLPLRRDPTVRDFLLLLRAVRDDFPRTEVLPLLDSPRVNWSALCDATGLPASCDVEVWARRAGLLGGLCEWRALLPEAAGQADWREEDGQAAGESAQERALQARGQAEVLAGALSALQSRLPQRPLAWSRQAGHLRRIWSEVMTTPQVEAHAAALQAVFDDLARRDVLPGGKTPVDATLLLDELERAVDGIRVPFHGAAEEGICVLDANQARGLTARHVILLGLQAGLFPRKTGEDPGLPDAQRQQLGKACAVPLAVSCDDDDEDRHLFGLLAGAAGERLTVSWQRASESGKAAMPSLALRELGRIALGTLDMERLIADHAEAVPAHPGHRLQQALQRDQALSAGDVELWLSLHHHRPGALQQLAARRADLKPGLRMLAETSPFSGPCGLYDGMLGPGVRPRQRHSPSSLQRLARCPLQYFSHYHLGLPDREEEPDSLSLSPRDMGQQVHALLEAFYRDLLDEGHFDQSEPAALTRQAVQDRVTRLWEQRMGDTLAARRERLPRLWTSLEATWIKSLSAFLTDDLQHMVQAGQRPVGLEQTLRDSLPLPAGREVAVRGTLDRIVDGEGGRIITDYKTGGRPDEQVLLRNMLKGLNLQAALYHLLSRPAARVEILGVGPAFVEPEENRIPGKKARPQQGIFEGFDQSGHRASFENTLATLADLAQGPRFPMNPGSGDAPHCTWCSFRRACRRNHPPSRAREQKAADGHAFRLMGQKSSRNLEPQDEGAEEASS